MYSFSSFSCLGIAKPSCKMYYLKFQLWCVTFLRFPSWSGFFLLGVLWVLCGWYPTHPFVQEPSVCVLLPCELLRAGTVSVSSFYPQKFTWCLKCTRCSIKGLYKHGINEKDILLVLEHLTLKVRATLMGTWLVVPLVPKSMGLSWPDSGSNFGSDTRCMIMGKLSWSSSPHL